VGGLVGALGAGSLDSASTRNVGIEALHDTEVTEGVLVAHGTLLLLGGSRAERSLNFLRIDDASDVRIGQAAGGQEVVLLQSSRLGAGTIKGLELLKGALSPDDEATEMATGGEGEQVQVAHVHQLDTGDVAEGLGNPSVLLEDDEGATALAEAAVTHLTLTGTQGAGVLDTLDVSIGSQLLQHVHGLLGLLAGLGLVADDQGELGDGLDTMATGEDKGGQGGGSQGADNGISALVHRHLAVPAAPNLGGRKHATTTTHVTESTLSRAPSTTTPDTGNTCDGTTGTPGLGRGLVTGLVADGVGLAAVLGEVGVHQVNDVGADGSGEDAGQLDGLLQGGSISAVNGDNGARGLS